MTALRFIFDDGGRAAAGYKGDAGDCVTRAIAIVTGLPYAEVYDELSRRQKAFGAGRSKSAKVARRKSSARTGVFREVYEPYLRDLGYEWVPTMKIGSGCKVHLRGDELPGGRIIATVSKHLCAVVEGQIRDTHDPSRDGKRCVYGYYRKAEPADGSSD